MSEPEEIDRQQASARVAANQAVPARDDSDEARSQSVFRQRATQLAARRSAAAAPAAARPSLVFSLGAECFCLPLASLSEVLPLARCSPVLGAPAQLAGVINVHGEIRSVLNLARLLELPEPPEDQPAQGYIIMAHHEHTEVGLQVDSVDRIAAIAAGGLEASDGEALAASTRYVKGRTADRISILDLTAIMAHEIFQHHRGDRDPSS